MKQSILLLLAVLVSALGLQAQQTVIVEPGPAGTLNQALTNPANQGKIFVLRRGIPYLLTSEIDITGVELHIRAEAGPGPRPLLVFSPPAGGTTPDQVISVRANMILEGLHLTAVNLLGSPAERIIRTRVDNVRLRVIDCLIDDAGQTAIRLDGRNNKVYMSRNVISRMGRPANPDNGRVVDDRGLPVDTLWMENNLIYNVTSRVIRDGGAAMNYVYFNKNTVVNVGQRGFEWGEVGEFVFTNNLIVNGAFLGRRISITPRLNDTARVVVAVTPGMGGTDKWVIRNNNFFRDSATVKATPAKQADNDTIVQVSLFTSAVAALIQSKGWTNSNISEVLNFRNPVPTQLDFITKHHAGTGATASVWDHAGLSPNVLYSALGSMSPRFSTYHNYDYGRTSRSFTAGTTGQPLGVDLGLVSSVPDLFLKDGILFFPNPVRNQLFVQNLKQEKIMAVRVFNLQGQLVADQRLIGDNVVFETEKWNNGMYILSLVDRSGNISSRKFIKQ